MTIFETVIKNNWWQISDEAPPLTKTAFGELKQSIAENDQYQPIHINQDRDILDVHPKACLELGIETEFELKQFENKLLEVKFVYDISEKGRKHRRQHQTKYLLPLFWPSALIF
jgi:hypothetical protein